MIKVKWLGVKRLDSSTGLKAGLEEYFLHNYLDYQAYVDMFYYIFHIHPKYNFELTADYILVYVAVLLLDYDQTVNLSYRTCRLPYGSVVCLQSGPVPDLIPLTFSRTRRTSLAFILVRFTRLSNPPVLPVSSTYGTSVSRDNRGSRPTRSSKVTMLFGRVGSGRVRAGKTNSFHRLSQAT